MSGAKNKLLIAAEALVEAATLEVDSLTQKKFANEMEDFNRNLAELSLDTDKNAGFFDELKKIVENQSSEITKLHGYINTANHNLNGIKNIMEQQLKLQKLSNAIETAHIGSFEYSSVHRPHKRKSKEYVQYILQHFLNGYGHYIPNTYFIGRYDESGKNATEAFRAALKTHVRILIGREPRIVKANNGKYAIYYS